MQKINLLHVISDHLATLKVVGGKGASIVDLFLFFGVPALITFALWKWSIFFSDTLLGHLSVAFSIVFGFLLNVQVLIFSMAKKSRSEDDATESNDRVVLMREMISNVSFAIMVALFALVLVIAMLFCAEQTAVRLWMNVILNYLVFVLILDILMIFKRIHTSLQAELSVNS